MKKLFFILLISTSFLAFASKTKNKLWLDPQSFKLEMQRKISYCLRVEKIYLNGNLSPEEATMQTLNSRKSKEIMELRMKNPQFESIFQATIKKLSKAQQ